MFHEYLHPFLLGGFPTATAEPSRVVQRSKSLPEPSKPFLIPKRTKSLTSQSVPIPSSPSAVNLQSLFNRVRQIELDKIKKPLPSIPTKENSEEGKGEVKDKNTDEKPLPAIPFATIATHIPRGLVRVTKMASTVKWVCCSENKHAHIKVFPSFFSHSAHSHVSCPRLSVSIPLFFLFPQR